MKLYFTPGACSMAPHIVLREATYDFDLESVDLAKKRTETGEDFVTINPKGYVPALKLDTGEILTEASVIVQYLADQKPASNLAPEIGTLERYRLMEWLNFISSEIHKQFAPLFKPTLSEESKNYQLELLGKRFDFLTNHFNENKYLMGNQFSVADAYLFTVLNWCHKFKIDLGKWPKLQAYVKQIADRPAVKETLKAEGLL
jgi:glutathione S-transferase